MVMAEAGTYCASYRGTDRLLRLIYADRRLGWPGAKASFTAWQYQCTIFSGLAECIIV
jgi:hypothetical protein